MTDVIKQNARNAGFTQIEGLENKLATKHQGSKSLECHKVNNSMVIGNFEKYIDNLVLQLGDHPPMLLIQQLQYFI